ncbi:hypothetical protein BJV78DRAFT_1284086 [Lactifluus subvellereus]|nr:hypothetical protein BJV78DRAFT_1284086 [Lactifluus subvellereus]
MSPQHRIGGDIIAAFEHRDRIRRIWISGVTSSLEATVMPLGPFPALEALDLYSAGLSSPTLPDAFLGGSAPRLQRLSLSGIPFPGLPRLLLSTSELVNLKLSKIPDTGYISPEAMITGLATLTRLQSLVIEFAYPPSHPLLRSRRPPPRTRTRARTRSRVVLPALNGMAFLGESEYLDGLVSGIHAPQLDRLSILFFNPLISDILQLSQFIGHAGVLRSCNRAELGFCHYEVAIVLYQQDLYQEEWALNFTVPCSGAERQVRSMAQISTSVRFSCPLLNSSTSPGHYNVLESTRQVDTQWLEIFRAFTAVRTLRISPSLHSFIIPVLQELAGGSATEVLPALDSLRLDTYPRSGPDQQAIELFIAARRRSGHPVTLL